MRSYTMSSFAATKSPCRVKLDHLETNQKCHFRSEAEALSRELNMRLYRTSVKDDLNVSVVFQHLAENYVHQWRLEQDLMRFDIGGGGPRSLAVCSPQSSKSRSSSASPTDCNGSTASSTGSSGSTGHPGGATAGARMSQSVSSSGYFSLTDFGPPPSLTHVFVFILGTVSPCSSVTSYSWISSSGTCSSDLCRQL